MIKTTFSAIAALIILLGIPCAYSEGIAWRHDPEAALAEAQKNNTIVMVDVYTDWCGWCQRLDETTYANETIIALLSKVVPLKVNPEQDDASAAFVEPLKVEGFPSIVFLDPTGKIIDRIDGYLGAASFIDKLSLVFKERGIAFDEPDRIRWSADPDAAFERAKKQSRQVILYVGSDDSRWCAELEESTWSDPDVVLMLKDYECVMIRVAGKISQRALLTAYGVIAPPTVLLIDPDGTLVCMIDGDLALGDLVNQIKRAASIKDRTAVLMDQYRAGDYVNVAELLGGLQDLGRYDELKSVFDTADSRVKIPGAERATFSLEIAMLLVRTEKLEETIPYLDIVESVEPAGDTTYYAYFLRGIVMSYQGKTDEALKYLSGLMSSPTIPELWKSRYQGFIDRLKGTP